MALKRTIEPRQLKEFKTYMRKGLEELMDIAKLRGIEVTSDMTKKEIINKLFQEGE